MHEHLETLHEEECPKHQPQQATKTTWNNKRNLGHTSSSDGEFVLKKFVKPIFFFFLNLDKRDRIVYRIWQKFGKKIKDKLYSTCLKFNSL